MNTSDDEAIAAAAETKKKTPKAAAAKGKATGKGKAAAGPKTSAKESSLLKQKSPAEFFAENKNIAGFDNPGKSLYTTLRELVENALDSAESISELPEIEITIEEITKTKFNTMIGLVDRQRVDEALYDDFESEKAREKRLAKEARFQESQAKNAALGKKVKDAPSVRGKGRGEAAFFKVTCKDNGRGMPHDDIPNMLGRVWSFLTWRGDSTTMSNIIGVIYIGAVLSGTKYGLRQTRGKFGLGAKMSKILHYMRQMAVITPYAQFLFKFLSDAADKNLTIKFTRRTDVMPPVPLQTKHHPSAVDLLLIKRLVAETTKQNLLQFLQHEFVNISKPHAERLIGEMGPDFSQKMAVKSLTSQQLVRIHQLFRQAKFDDPSGNCLSPAGEYNLRLGIIKELHPDMVATHASSPQVFEGHPFIVEAGISIGGKDVKQGLNIFRFANRIPLLFEQGADVITRTAAKRISWSSYKINQQQDKIGVFVSIVSTKIPFKGTGKEYIGDDITEISSAVKSALKQCCLQLKSKIVKKLQALSLLAFKLTTYIPDVARAVMETLVEIADQSPPKRPRYDKEDEELLEKVNSQEVTEMTFRDCLTQHVEQVDYEMALDYAMQSGVSEEPREAIYLNSLEGSYKFVDLQSPVFVFRFVH
ncbi:DNA topoisomerase 6 subunit B [Zea mays]|uniref:DNA topoisomerase 6 subunit B n=1 Tax=Zea mays TaxID=4577 RepID=A0A1D6I196_MAIZE|nr:DNA topoisomerase 6 subunit B [Zea mays]